MSNSLSMTISSLSREFVRFGVTNLENGVAADPTLFPVDAAFTAKDVDPQSGDWKAASWESGDGPKYFARCLVGPGGTVTLAKGRYDAYTRINTGSELVIEKAGILVVI